MGGWFIPLLLIGCRDAGSSVARATVTDSAGITIVANHDAGTPAVASWIVDSVPTLAIGREDGPDPYRFDGIDDVTRRSDSTIIVADASASIRLFDKRGAFLHEVGRRGEGPGEYRVISMLKRVRSDSLLVWDFPAHRITLLSADGQFGRSEQGPVTEGFFYGLDVFADGSLLGMYDPPPTGARPANGVLETTMAVVRFSPDSGVMDTLEQISTGSSYVTGGEHFTITSIPYHAEALGVADGQAAYLGNSTRFEIGHYDSDGRLRRLIRLNRAPTPLQPFIRDNYIARQLARARTSADSERVRGVYSDMPFPKVLPAYAELAVDADSNLWVSSFTTSDSLPTQWTIFDPEGRLLAETVTPARFRVSEIGRSDIIGVRADSLGIEQVQVVRIRKPE
jgi:hypothetical protein